jgi:hypothetical protein
MGKRKGADGGLRLEIPLYFQSSIFGRGFRRVWRFYFVREGNNLGGISQLRGLDKILEKSRRNGSE